MVIPPEAIAAAAEAIECCLLRELPPDGCMTWLDADEELARTALEAAEAVWPHEPPKRDPASTTTTMQTTSPPRRAP